MSTAIVGASPVTYELCTEVIRAVLSKPDWAEAHQNRSAPGWHEQPVVMGGMARELWSVMADVRVWSERLNRQGEANAKWWIESNDL